MKVRRVASSFPFLLLLPLSLPSTISAMNETAESALHEMSFFERIQRDLLHNETTQHHVFTILESLLIGIAFLVVTGVVAGMVLLCFQSIRKMIVRVGPSSKASSIELPEQSHSLSTVIPTVIHPNTSSRHLPPPVAAFHFHHARPPPRRLRMNI